jgi:prevent-host-death family protein
MILGQELVVMSIRLSQDIRPVSDLKSHGAELVRQVTEQHRPVVLSRHGRAVAVLLSVEEYEDMQDLVANAELRRAVEEAEAQIDAGRGVSHAVVVDELQRMVDGAE